MEIRHEGFEDSAHLSDPDIFFAEIIEDPQSAIEELQAISDDLAQTLEAEGDSDE